MPDGAPPVRVREIRFDRDIDVAVLTLAEPVPPFPGWSETRRDARWEVDARWLENDPLLTGEVTSPRRTVRLDSAERDADVIQLLVNQHVGGHSGYSGTRWSTSRGASSVSWSNKSRHETFAHPAARPTCCTRSRFVTLSNASIWAAHRRVNRTDSRGARARQPHAADTVGATGPLAAMPPPAPSPNGDQSACVQPLDTLVTGGSDGTLRLWDQARSRA